MKRDIFLFLFFFILAVVSLSFPFSALHSQILINELLADPARDWNGDGDVDYRNDEWIEIINIGSTAVSLDSMFIADGNAQINLRFGLKGGLEPYGVLVIFGSDAVAWETENGFPAYGLSLNNSGDRVSVVRIERGDTIVIDSVDFGSSAADDDRSIGRGIEKRDVWYLFDAYNPCTSGCDFESSGCIPTPGSANTCTTGTEDSSWGAIKSFYAE